MGIQMVLSPHKKNVGLVFFGVLILVALFLFVSDKFRGSRGPEDHLLGPVSEGGLLEKSKIVSSNGPSTAFEQVNWQEALAQGSTKTETAYDMASIKTISAPSKSDLRSYASSLKSALRRYSDPSTPNEVRIMFSAYRDNRPDALAGIDAMITLHKETLTDLVSVAVPEQMSFYHKSVMNSILAITLADEGMKKVFTDSDLAFAASRAYAADIDSLQSNLQKISSLILKQGVVLNDSEKLKIYLGTNI